MQESICVTTMFIALYLQWLHHDLALKSHPHFGSHLDISLVFMVAVACHVAIKSHSLVCEIIPRALALS